MTPLQALDLVDQAAALAPLTRAQQVQVVQAVQLVRAALTEPAGDPPPRPAGDDVSVGDADRL